VAAHIDKVLKRGSRTERYFKLFWGVLTMRERYFFVLLGTLFIVSFVFVLGQVWISQTNALPEYGGTYREGIVGSPRFINPLLAQTNDADRDLAQLVFSGLMRYTRSGELSPSLAESFEIKEDGKTYEFVLRENLFWHDEEPLTTEDIAFTVKLLQDPEYQSPLRVNWQGVEVNVIDERRIQLILKGPYAPFLETTTMGILPKHVWEDVTAQNFALAEANLKPIGSGPFQLQKFKKDRFGEIKEVRLITNPDFHLGRPFVKEFIFKFYTHEDDMIRAFKGREIDGMASVSAGNIEIIRNEKRIDLKRIFIPRYFAVFFNQTQSKAISDIHVRTALATRVNRQEIIEEILKGEAIEADSPIPKNMKAYSEDITRYPFSPEEAKNILEEASWQDTDGDGIREKDDEQLEFTLVTTASQGLERVADILQKQWGAIGARVDVQIIGAGELQNDFIRPRNYQALLFGEILGNDPDPFSFWHSSQKRDPGLNLSLYENKKVDKLLEEARQNPHEDERIEKYAEFQKLVTQDIPAVFLYSPYHLYPVNKKLKGVDVTHITDPSQRFSEVETWFINTRRVWK